MTLLLWPVSQLLLEQEGRMKCHLLLSSSQRVTTHCHPILCFFYYFVFPKQMQFLYVPINMFWVFYRITNPSFELFRAFRLWGETAQDSMWVCSQRHEVKPLTKFLHLLQKSQLLSGRIGINRGTGMVLPEPARWAACQCCVLARPRLLPVPWTHSGAWSFACLWSHTPEENI